MPSVPVPAPAGPRRLPAPALSMFLAIAALLLAAAARPAPLAAQGWNSPGTLDLVRRAVGRRLRTQADTGLRSYRTRAHGFVFFLAQVGEGLSGPPRLIKADELDVEVYWAAPDRSKQNILGWRDGRWLPTDIHYHRDHLGIVTNNFGDLIRIGEGDEVRDAVHPLSPGGLEAYDFALRDSVRLRSPAGEIAVHEIEVRPRSFARPLVVGTLYLDVASAELVRFRFSFTPAAYLDDQVEDISIVLENALYEGRFWLPVRQEVEIRRRTQWLDFPARGIIRGRWELGEYELNVPLPDEVFAGPPIGGLVEPGGGHLWPQPLEQAIRDVAEPVNEQDMAAVRDEVERIAGNRALSGLASRRLATGSLSDLVRVNRVQGLALGLGGTLRLGWSRVLLRPRVGYGTSDERVTGAASLELPLGGAGLTLSGSRAIRDVGDLPVIAPALNSILAQEAGRDYGDYVLLHAAGVGLRHRLSARSALRVEAGVEEARSVAVEATPANGTYRDNPPLGSGTRRVARLRLERASAGIGVRNDLQGALVVEGGEGASDYYRVSAEVHAQIGLGGTRLVARGLLGAGGGGLPPHRSFVLGGRGTLLGEPFRAYGGRRLALAHLEWQVDAPFPAVPLGSFASTGRSVTLAPFVSLGWSERPVPGTPWRGTGGLRPVIGIAAEWFMRLLRVEAGWAPRTGGFGVTVDVSREWWGIL